MKRYSSIKSLLKRDLKTHKIEDTELFQEDAFKFLSTTPWRVTEKVDGTNMRVLWDGQKQTLDIRGRGDKASIPGPLGLRMESDIKTQFDLFESTFKHGTICFYGEGYGPGIQKGGDYVDDEKPNFVLFDVKRTYTPGDGELYRGEEYEEFLSQDLVTLFATRFQMLRAHEFGWFTPNEIIPIVQRGFKSKLPGADKAAEGVVLRAHEDLTFRGMNRLIAKLKTEDFPNE